MCQINPIKLVINLHYNYSLAINKRRQSYVNYTLSKIVLTKPKQNQKRVIQNILKQTSMQIPHIQHLHRLPVAPLQLSQNYEQYATQTLIAITESQQNDKSNLDRQRTELNGSEITRWNHNYLNILKYECVRRKEPKVRLIKERHVPSENSCVSRPLPNCNYSFKKELSRLRVPLREKTLNSEQLMNSSLQKQRSKTRNDIKLEIINSKPEIMPANSKAKSKTDGNCENIVKFKKDFKDYQKIRRKNCTLDHFGERNKEAESTSHSKLKYFFLNQLQSPKINLQGSSIRQLLAK